MTGDSFLSPQEIAREMRVSDRMVRYLIESEKLPAIRWGNGRGVWRVRRSAFEALLRERETSKEGRAE